MGKYLDLAVAASRAREPSKGYEKNEINEINRISSFNSFNSYRPEASDGPYHPALHALDARCPALVECGRWRQAVDDGRAFLARWGEQAAALGWTAHDLFGLHEIPEHPEPNYRRLSRYDCIGLIWLLCTRPVVALTEVTAAIMNPAGAITVYRKHNKPALGPEGDSLDDFAS